MHEDRLNTQEMVLVMSGMNSTNGIPRYYHAYLVPLRSRVLYGTIKNCNNMNNAEVSL